MNPLRVACDQYVVCGYYNYICMHVSFINVLLLYFVFHFFALELIVQNANNNCCSIWKLEPVKDVSFSFILGESGSRLMGKLKILGRLDVEGKRNEGTEKHWKQVISRSTEWMKCLVGHFRNWNSETEKLAISLIRFYRRRKNVKRLESVLEYVTLWISVW